MNRHELINSLRDVRSHYAIMKKTSEAGRVDEYMASQIASQATMSRIIDDLIDAMCQRFPMKLKRDIEATYVAEVDCTVVWQYMYFEEERHGQPDIDHEPIQQTILGWYHGEPNDEDNKHYSNSTIIGDYLFGGE